MSGFGLHAATVLASAEPLLVAVAGILALVILGLIAMALMVRKRSRPVEEPVTEPVRLAPPPDRPPPPKPRVRPQLVRGGGGGGLAVATSTAMVCPTCRTEYHGMTYCTRDARR